MGGELIRGDIETKFGGVTTDSRTAQPGDLFFALIGERSDGHEHVQAAVDAGAVGAVVSRSVRAATNLILVPETLVALGELAAWHRRRFDVEVVGITGSVGKTTTKEMTSAVLERRFRVLRNAGNYNNEIGVPLTVFQLRPEHEVLVQEMAMRMPGEIARLAHIAGPDIGVITNIGLAHIERLGSQENIAAAKAELLESLPPDGVAVLNADDPYLAFLSSRANCEVVVYGVAAGHVRADDVALDVLGRPRFRLSSCGESAEVVLSVVGEHNIPNALAAAAVGISLGVPFAGIAEALEEFAPLDRRAHLIEAQGGWTIFDDTYNASPASMTSALRTLSSVNGQRRIAVLGDMKELGDFAPQAHREAGRLAARSGIAMLVVVGNLAQWIADGAAEVGFAGETVQCADADEAAEIVRAKVRAGDVVLVKGSRAMEMEKVVEWLR
jgi:UDP-N-acetylmuramoyl-tripeptide--D-alanyl-D-alanine ligase